MKHQVKSNRMLKSFFLPSFKKDCILCVVFLTPNPLHFTTVFGIQSGGSGVLLCARRRFFVFGSFGISST